MRFKAHYQTYLNAKLPDYWRTIDANDLKDATKIAKQYERKGYRMITMEQEA